MSATVESETAHPVAAGVSRESHVRTLPRNDLTMKKTVQQPAPESIGQTPEAHSEKPDAPHNWMVWSDERWLESGAPPSVQNRLMRVDRALQGVRAIHDLLALNFQRNNSIRYHGDEASCAFSGLTDSHEEGLYVAMRVLLDTADVPIGELRDNDGRCWGGNGGAR